MVVIIIIIIVIIIVTNKGGGKDCTHQKSTPQKPSRTFGGMFELNFVVVISGVYLLGPSLAPDYNLDYVITECVTLDYIKYCGLV